MQTVGGVALLAALVCFYASARVTIVVGSKPPNAIDPESESQEALEGLAGEPENPVQDSKDKEKKDDPEEYNSSDSADEENVPFYAQDGLLLKPVSLKPKATKTNVALPKFVNTPQKSLQFVKGDTLEDKDLEKEEKKEKRQWLRRVFDTISEEKSALVEKFGDGVDIAEYAINEKMPSLVSRIIRYISYVLDTAELPPDDDDYFT